VAGMAVAVWIGTRHDFSSVQRMEAARYELLLPEELAEDAQAMLGDLDVRRTG
jgi:hypothetical protein